MKPQTLFNITLPLLLTLSGSAWAQSGANGGGKGVPQSDFILLSDLSSRTCDAKENSNFLQDAGIWNEINEVLKALDEVNPYMSFRIRKEMQRLEWCLTSARLARLQTQDANSLLISFDPEVQIAIREINPEKENNTVFLDSDYFNRMKPKPSVLGNQITAKFNRAMLPIHETLHSFLPLDQANRNQALRTLTKAIYNNFAAKLAKRTLDSRKANLDAAIHQSSTQMEFESSDFGAGWAGFVYGIQPAQSAQIMAFTGKNPAKYLGLLIGDLRRASILGYSPFRDEYFENEYRKETRVPTQFRFDLARKNFRDFIRAVDDVEVGNARPGEIFPTILQTDYGRFGGCMAQWKHYERAVVKFFFPDVHIRAQFIFDATFTPQYGAAKNQVIQLALKTGNMFTKEVWAFGIQQTRWWFGPKEKIAAFDRNLTAWLDVLKAGRCDDRNSSEEKFLTTL